MKAAEKNANKHACYEQLENDVDSRARECFKRPAYTYSKKTAIAALRVIERGIDRLDDGSRRQLVEIAMQCVKRHGETVR